MIPLAAHPASASRLPAACVSAGVSMRPPIFKQRLPKYNQRQKSRQHQRCEHHLNDREAGRVFAKKPACNKAASTQEPVGGPSEPIKHISLRRPLSSAGNTRDSPPAPMTDFQ